MGSRIDGGKICITQADRYREKGSDAFTGNWTLCGFREILPFCNLGYMITAEELLEKNGGRWFGATFKNGRGRYVLVDNDHGTRRTWGDRINSICEVKQ